MRLYSNHDRKAAITEPLLLFSLKPGFPAGLSLFPRPSIAASHFTKTRVEIAVLVIPRVKSPFSGHKTAI